MDNMVYLGPSDLLVSRVGLGTWALGNDYFGDIDPQLAMDALRAGVDEGINLIDTAPAYGDGYAEELVGQALKGRRDQVVLATKCGVLRFYGTFVRCLHPTVLRAELENSLQRLNTDVIDLYQIHWPDRNNRLEDALDMLLQMRDQGKIRAIGVSNFPPELIRKACDWAGIVSVQPQLSLLNQESLKDVIPFARELGLGVLTYGALGGGILTGRFTAPVTPRGNDKRSDFYPFYQEPWWSRCQQLLRTLQEIARERHVSVAEISINWVLAQPGVTCALVGASRPRQAQANAHALQWALTQEEVFLIDRAYKEIFP